MTPTVLTQLPTIIPHSTLAQASGGFSSAIASAPILVHICVGVALIAGMILWAAGRKVITGVATAVGLGLGGLLGFVILPLIMPSVSISPWIGLVGGATSGIILSWLVTRAAVAGLFGIISALTLGISMAALFNLSGNPNLATVQLADDRPSGIGGGEQVTHIPNPPPTSQTRKQSPTRPQQARTTNIPGPIWPDGLGQPIFFPPGNDVERPVIRASTTPRGPLPGAGPTARNTNTSPQARGDSTNTKPRQPERVYLALDEDEEDAFSGGPAGGDYVIKPNGKVVTVPKRTIEPEIQARTQPARVVERRVQLERESENQPRLGDPIDPSPKPANTQANSSISRTASKPAQTTDVRTKLTNLAKEERVSETVATARSMWNAGVRNVKAWWSDRPKTEQYWIAGASALGLALGIGAGLFMPAWAAGGVTAVIGTGIWLPCTLWLAHGLGIPGLRNIEWSTNTWLLLGIMAALIGVAIQWKGLTNSLIPEPAKSAKPGKPAGKGRSKK